MDTVENFSASKTVPFSFYEVVATIFNRYPNPCSSHVQCTDYIEPLRVGSDAAISCKILNHKTNSLPSWIQKYQDNIGAPRYDPKTERTIRVIKIIEEYKIDLVRKHIQHLSWNLDSRNMLKTHEFCQYQAVSLPSSKSGHDNTSFPASLSPSTASTNSTSDAEAEKCLREQVMIRKQMLVASPLHWSLSRPMLHFAGKKWLKQETRATYGLCYTIAKNLYNQKLANDFVAAGLNDTALAKMKQQLTFYRTMLYENRHLFISEKMNEKMNQAKLLKRKVTETGLLQKEKSLEKFQDLIKREQAMTQKIRDDIRGYIRNPKFQLMVIERMKKMPK